MLKSDCGGFGFIAYNAYNNVDSVLEALVGYQVYKNIHVYSGYCAHYAARSGSTNDIAGHSWFYDPMLGTAFSF